MNNLSPSTTIMLGHTLDVLRQLPDNLFHACITSPPYWGLRPNKHVAVWQSDSAPLCKEGHEWTECPLPMTKNMRQGSTEIYKIPQIAGELPPQGYWCAQCEAWRGALGSEPTVGLYTQHLVQIFTQVYRVLRPDATLWLNLGDTYNGSGGAGGEYNEGGLRSGQPKYPGHNDTSLKPKDLCGVPWTVAFALRDHLGFYLRGENIWWKPNARPEGALQDRFCRDHEQVFLFSKSSQYWFDQTAVAVPAANGENRIHRTVWRVPTSAYKGAHFATFPVELAQIAIKASTPRYGVCATCGEPARRMTLDEVGVEGSSEPSPYWSLDCSDSHEGLSPALILDPFGGSGTTALAANSLTRNALIIDISDEYCELARSRIESELGMISNVQIIKSQEYNNG